MDEQFIFNKNSYVSFDGTSLKDIIVDRLNRGQVFTDQNYQGSNLAAVIDIIAYSFSNLLFYLNKTSSESMFSESQIYENMNRIVKLLNYKPLGPQGQNVPIRIAVNNLAKNNYIIPRYSYIPIGTTSYSFTNDVSFSKKTDDLQENITDIDDEYSLVQGTYEEYPIYTSAGIDNEKVFLSVDEKILIDNFNIDVYVKPYNTTTWQKWTRVNDLFLHKANDSVYEVRYNENKRYEINFGDNINGRKLQQGDQVAVYYLRIDSGVESLGTGAVDGSSPIRYNSVQFSQILSDTGIQFGNYLSPFDILNVILSNAFPSTDYSQEENVDNIRKNAPKNFRTQYRLVTLNDYESYIRTNYSNLLTDIKVLTNEEYLKQHIRYLYNLGLKNPQDDTKILYNQVRFANSCNFNNLYVYMVSKNANQEYLTPSQKEFILEGLNPVKTITTQIIPADPVYMYIDFYLKNPSSPITTNDINETKLLIYKTTETRRSSSAIALDVKGVFEKYFSRTTSRLGQLIDIYQLSNELLNIDGVQNIQTRRSDVGIEIEGISFLIWNPIYPDDDISVYTQNIIIENFKFPIFNNISNILDRIEIVERTNAIRIADF
jgi:hypothetical protein